MADKIKTYPIGTKIKFIGRCEKCKGKMGKVVGVCEDEKRYWVILPLSTCASKDKGGRIEVPWSCLVPIVQKNQQLLFSFMTP